MFARFSNMVTNLFIMMSVIQEEDKELYQYGVEQICSIVLNIMTTVIIGVLYGMISEILIFMFAYIPLRIYAGGFHAKTSLRCYLCSVAITIIALSVMKFVKIPYFICIIAAAVSSIVILSAAPIEDKNKPLDSVEKTVFKKRTVFIWLAEIILLLIFLILKLDLFVVPISLSMLLEGIMLVLGIIKNKQ